VQETRRSRAGVFLNCIALRRGRKGVCPAAQAGTFRRGKSLSILRVIAMAGPRFAAPRRVS
jgi:hypothetical protein